MPQVFEWEATKRPETLTDIQRAARFFYLQQHAFGGRVDGQTFGTATTGPSINLLRIEENLSAAHLRLQGTYVEHLPWIDCLSRYDRPHTFFYADPPYWETEGYGVPFAWDQYVRMEDAMGKIRGKFMLSINNHPAIRELFSRYPMFDLDIKYSVGNTNGDPKTSSELVILNWEPNESGDLFR